MDADHVLRNKSYQQHKCLEKGHDQREPACSVSRRRVDPNGTGLHVRPTSKINHRPYPCTFSIIRIRPRDLIPDWTHSSSYRQARRTCLVRNIYIIAAKPCSTGVPECISPALIDLVGRLALTPALLLVLIVLSRVLRVGKCKASN